MLNTSSLDSWLICPKPNPDAQIRLFCFPYAGGSANIFRRWSNHLPNTIEVCAVELPGRGMRIKLPPFTQLEPLITELASVLKPKLDKPFAFFGHSMGGLVSFELALLLRKKYGINPNHLFVSAHRAPQLVDPKPPIHNLPEAEFIAELRRLNGTPQTLLENEELMQLFLPILRADFAVLETYVYTQQAPLNIPITAFGGLEDQEVSRDQIQAWQEQTSASFALHMFPGDHFFLHSFYSSILEIISQQIIV
ncbi:thioesterase II family protein [Fischerella thermalis]|uniref:thioesterase II family protein n=1 Tax=Fischerella thermalis TaxID=372787 RepID=UPI0015E0DEB0|nr:thioesterase II family protein [Fischerella thermalis]MBF1990183.1 thioesterase [Fischerella thermalis M58_A2018_009]MBF2058807.1 thioesterase [Fischerella thermalis M66_A2018_004]MBF2069968.1 thioesterase [Fischerella thermalis M48_A2018_028]